MSASVETPTRIAGSRPPGPNLGEDDRATAPPPIRVVILGATGYVGGELVRLLARHPSVAIAGLVGRDRSSEPIDAIHAHLARAELVVDEAIPDADAYFLALPHGAAAAAVPGLLERAAAIVDLGPDFRLRDPADYPRWYGFEHPHPELLETAVYGLPELHRAELARLSEAARPEVPRVVGAPGCYPTATLLALAPLARAGLIGDLVVDAKSGVSGAGREAKPDLGFAEVNESVKAYGVFSHRHTAEIEQELATIGSARGADNPGAAGVDFLPHLVPMTRGIHASAHVRPTRPIEQDELDALYREAYEDEPFVRVVDAPPATKHVLGSNEARVFARVDPRTGRIVAIGVVDNLVKGAAGQAVQAFNLIFGLPESAGLDQLPIAP